MHFLKTCFTTLLRVRRSCSSKKCFIGSNFCFVKAVENKSGSSELLLYVSLKYLINIRKRKKLVKCQNCIIFSPTAQRANLSKRHILVVFKNPSNTFNHGKKWPRFAHSLLGMYIYLVLASKIMKFRLQFKGCVNPKVQYNFPVYQFFSDLSSVDYSEIQ